MVTKQKTKVKSKTKQKSGSVGKVQNARVEALRKQLVGFKTNADKSYVGISRGLREVYRKDYWKDYGYDSLETYAQTELDMELRVVRHYIKIADKMDELGITEKQAIAIGWSKMKEVVRIATTKNIKKWLEQAQKCSLRDIAKKVSLITKSEDSTTGTGPKIITMSMKMSEEQNSSIVDAINAAKEMSGSEDPVEALQQVSLEWMELKGKVPKMLSLEDRIKYIEKMYGVKLVVKGDAKTPVQKKKVAKKTTGEKKPMTKEKDAKKTTKKVVKKGAKKKGKAKEEDINSILNDGDSEKKAKKGKGKEKETSLPKDVDKDVDSDINDMLGLE